MKGPKAWGKGSKNEAWDSWSDDSWAGKKGAKAGYGKQPSWESWEKGGSKSWDTWDTWNDQKPADESTETWDTWENDSSGFGKGGKGGPAGGKPVGKEWASTGNLAPQGGSFAKASSVSEATLNSLEASQDSNKGGSDGGKDSVKGGCKPGLILGGVRPPPPPPAVRPGGSIADIPKVEGKGNIILPPKSSSLLSVPPVGITTVPPVGVTHVPPPGLQLPGSAPGANLSTAGPRRVMPPSGSIPTPAVSQLVQALLPRAVLAASALRAPAPLPLTGPSPSLGDEIKPDPLQATAAMAAAVSAAAAATASGEEVPPPPPGPPPASSISAAALLPANITALAIPKASSGEGSNLPSNLYMDQAGFIREVGTPGLVPITLQAPPPPTGLPPGFADQIRLQISQVENTSGKPCRFRRGCKKLDCADEHPEGREIAEDPESLVCRFRRKCKRGDCFYLHPAGREMDEDPSKGMCKLGKTCTKPECIFSHPEGRATVIQVRCHACGEVGHIQKDCPSAKSERRCRNCGQNGHIMRDCPLGYKRGAAPDGTFVAVTGFPAEWSSKGDDHLKESVAAELEVFGTLSAQPEIVEDGKKVVAGFADPELAREAVQALNGAAFEIELCAAPSTVLALIGNEDDNEVSIRGFPQRWTAADLGGFLRGALKKNTIQDIEITTAKDAETGTPGEAKLVFQDGTDARKACIELKGQKVAGKKLSLLIGGKEVDEEADSGRDRGGGRDYYDQDRYRSRSPQRYGTRQEEKHAFATVHVDELLMPRRPALEPSKSDREVYVDPLPDEEELKTWMAAFGEAEDVFRIPDPVTGKPGEKGYVRFKDHAEAARCVKSGTGTWSESERVLSSQRSQHGGRDSAYPDSMVARILGPRGDLINSLKLELGASHLAIRGDGLGESDKMSSLRVHFICKGPPEALSKLKKKLEEFVEEVHEAVTAKIQNKEAPKRKRSGSRPRMVLDRTRGGRSRSGGRRRGGDRDRYEPPPAGEVWRPPGDGAPGPGEPWRPPGPPPNGSPWGHPPPGGPWAPPPYGHPPPGYPPWGPPPGYSPWGPPPPGPPPPRPDGGGAAGSPPPGHWDGPPPGSWGSGPPPLAEPALPALPEPERERSDGPPPSAERETHRDSDSAPPPVERAGSQQPGGGPGVPPAACGGSVPDAARAGFGGRDGFFSQLPSQLTPGEASLAGAIVDFLKTWAAGNEPGKHPNLVHLGADPRIREMKTAALPPEVALRSWIEQRLPHQVALVKDSGGKATLQLVSQDVAAPVPHGREAEQPREARGSRGEDPGRGGRSRSRRRRRRREEGPS